LVFIGVFISKSEVLTTGRLYSRSWHDRIATPFKFLFTHFFQFFPLFIVFVFIYPHNIMVTTTFICRPYICVVTMRLYGCMDTNTIN